MIFVYFWKVHGKVMVGGLAPRLDWRIVYASHYLIRRCLCGLVWLAHVRRTEVKLKHIAVEIQKRSVLETPCFQTSESCVSHVLHLESKIPVHVDQGP